MSELDESLQEKLQAVENGVPIGQVLSDVRGDHQDEASLLRMVAQMKTIEHPQLEAAKAKQIQNRLVQETYEKTRGNHKAHGISISRLRPHFARPRLWGGLAMLTAAFGLIMAGLWFSGPSSAHAATLMDITGTVEVASGPSAGDWHTVANGDTLRKGQVIRTAKGSGAELVFFEGSRASVGADTELLLKELDGRWGNVLKVAIEQHAGKTDHSVVPFRGKPGRFEVYTPSGNLSVHGTTFGVLVDRGGKTRFSVDTGLVEINNGTSELLLSAGQAAFAAPGEALASPSYQFNVTGTISAMDGNQWTVGGVSFGVADALVSNGSFQVGDNVLVSGRILQPDLLTADVIEPSLDDPSGFTFTGVVESIGEGFWVVGGNQVWQDANSPLDNITVGTPVQVTATVLEDGRWQIVTIVALEEPEPEQSTPTNTPDPSETASPTDDPNATPTETPTLTPEVSATPEPTLVTDCTGADPQPKGMSLSQEYGVPYEEIMGWFCQQGNGFGEIDQAYGLSLSSGKTVEEIFALRQSGMGWGQIKQMLDGKPTKEVKPTKTPKPAKEAKPPKPPKPGNGKK